jgi:hypothetical protein
LAWHLEQVRLGTIKRLGEGVGLLEIGVGMHPA